MSDDEVNQCFFPACSVERMGNVVMIHCNTEDDAIVAFEIFKEISLGKPCWIGRADE